ncbi:hypothetical protein ACFZAM_31905 [Streptomyces sp. NPDC008079]|uniref:hypothetical protein n=1 Tax=Streptomyces sp. NPDC008079 TaxID=3364806 RepID=UPI0036F0014A
MNEPAAYAPSYVYAFEGDLIRYITAAEAAEAVGRVLADSGEVTTDGFGAITLHLGEDRTEHHTLTPSAPAQLAEHRKDLARSVAHWTKQADDAQNRANGFRAAPRPAHPDHAYQRESRITSAQRAADRARAKADEVQAALDTLTAPADSLRDPAPPR